MNNKKFTLVILSLILANYHVGYAKKTVKPYNSANVLMTDLDRRLQKAAGRGKLIKVKSLIKRGAKINSKDGAGFTPLHLAALYGQEETFEYLLENGADVHALSDGGFSPLHNARTVKIAQLLLDHGVKINIQAANGETPLSLAACESVGLFEISPELPNRLDVKKFLKEKGAKKDLGRFRQIQNSKRLVLLNAYVHSDKKYKNEKDEEIVKEKLFVKPMVLREFVEFGYLCQDGKVLEFADEVARAATLIKKSFCQNNPEGYECTLAQEVFQKLKK